MLTTENQVLRVDGPAKVSGAAQYAIQVAYDELRTVPSIDDARRPDALPIHPERDTYLRGDEYPDFPISAEKILARLRAPA